MSIENCSDSLDALFSLIEEIKLGYQEPNKVVNRGRKLTFSHLSFLLLAVVAVVTKTFSWIGRVRTIAAKFCALTPRHRRSRR